MSEQQRLPPGMVRALGALASLEAGEPNTDEDRAEYRRLVAAEMQRRHDRTHTPDQGRLEGIE